MNKALVLIEALQNIGLKITSEDWKGDEESLLTVILTIADDAVNTVGGREEVEHMFEDLRFTGRDVKRLVDAIIPVLTAVDDLTDLGVSGA
jgi:hypothetical protein